MTRLAWRLLWHRPAAVVATFVAMVVAVGIVTCCGILLESGIRAHGSAQRYAAASAVVATTDIRQVSGSGEDREVERLPLPEPARLSPALVAKVAAAPGVRSAVADRTIDVRATGHGSAAGVEAHPWPAIRLSGGRLVAGDAVESTSQAVVGRSVADSMHLEVGSRMTLESSRGTRTFTVSGIVAGAGTDAAYLNTGAMRALDPHPGAVDAIGVIGDPGRSDSQVANAVRAVLPSVPAEADGAFPRVFSGDARGEVEDAQLPAAREFVIAASAASGGIALMTAMLVIAGTVAVSVTGRQRDIALLRATAATPGQVRRLLLRETVWLAVIAGAVGVIPGIWASHWVRDGLVDRELVSEGFQVTVSWLPPLVAAAAALLVGVVATYAASMRPSRVSPTAALTDSKLERRRIGPIRLLLGMLAGGGGITLAVLAGNSSATVAASVTVPGALLLIMAVAFWSPVLLQLLVRATGWVLLAFREPGRVARADLIRAPRQASGVLTALVLAMTVGAVMWSFTATQQHAAHEQVRAGVTADRTVAPPDGTGVNPAQLQRIRQVYGVQAATGITRSNVFSTSDDSALAATGLDGDVSTRTLDFGVASGSMAKLHGNAIALDTRTARELGLHVGDRFTGWFGDGAVAAPKVVATYDRGLGLGAVVLPGKLLREHTGSMTLDSVLVSTAPAHRDSTTRALERVATTAQPGATVGDGATVRTQSDSDVDRNAWTNQLVGGIMIGYAVIAAVNTLVATTLARRRDIAVLRLSGMTHRQGARVLGLERLLLAGIAVAVSAATSLALLLPGLRSTVGDVAPYLPPVAWGVAALLVVAVLLVAFVPTQRVLRSGPIESVGVRE